MLASTGRWLSFLSLVLLVGQALLVVQECMPACGGPATTEFAVLCMGGRAARGSSGAEVAGIPAGGASSVDDARGCRHRAMDLPPLRPDPPVGPVSAPAPDEAAWRIAIVLVGRDVAHGSERRPSDPPHGRTSRRPVPLRL